MATRAKPAKGTKLMRGDGGGTEVFTTIGEVVDFSGPENEVAVIDATSFDSVADEVIAGLPKTGPITFNLLYVGGNAQQQGLEADRVAGTLRNFRLQLNDHATTPTILAVSAIVNKVGLSGGGSNQAYKRSITITPSGAMTVVQWGAT